MPKYIDIQHALVRKYRITIDTYSSCWSRMNVHPRERRVCKFAYANSYRRTFSLMHEIGHIEGSNSKARRCEDEYNATQWAIDHLADYGLEPDKEIIASYQRYINREHARGVRRHCKTLPPLETLQLKFSKTKKSA